MKIMKHDDVITKYFGEEGSEKRKKFEESLIEDVECTVKKQEIIYNQLNRAHKKFRDNPKLFNEVVNKLRAKYYSDEYVNFWREKGYTPPETLLWFLLDYAEAYGRECTQKEWEVLANMFTSKMYFIHDWYFMRMDGQGSVTIQIKADEQVKSLVENNVQELEKFCVKIKKNGLY